MDMFRDNVIKGGCTIVEGPNFYFKLLAQNITRILRY